jgi:16S rRNA processing protein RimM
VASERGAASCSRLTADTIVVGRVGRPHGLDGAFVVDDPSEDPERFAVGASLLVDGEPATIAERKWAGGRLVIRVDRPVARGARLEIPRDELPPPSDDEYYVFQLVGLEVVEESGRNLGRVRDVASAPANDVLELDTGRALPMVEDCVLQVDLSGRRIVVARGFADPD